MTNDTSTLNGALTELGELMADNLVTMGVTDADASDGLTTLANRILDIQGGGGIAIALVSDKSNISYLHSETAILSAYVFENGSAKSGATVEFFKGATSLGTSTTDSNGLATKTYTATGDGNLSITAQTNSITSNTVSITDYWWYSTTEYSAIDTPNTSMPSAFKVEFDIKPTSRTNTSGYIEIGTSTTNCLLAGQLASTGINGVYIRTNNSYTTRSTVTSMTNLNQDNHITLDYDGTNWTYECNNETVTGTTPSFGLGTFVRIYPTSPCHLKNIKIMKM